MAKRVTNRKDRANNAGRITSSNGNSPIHARRREVEGAADGPRHFSDWGSLVSVKVIQIAEIISRSASQVYEAGYGIRNSELRILLLLGTGETLSVNEISRRAGIDKAWISRSLDAMMKSGLTKRVSHPTDSRKSLVSLTDKGHQTLRTITPIALMRDKEIIAGLDKKQVHQVLDALKARAQQMLLPEREQRPAPAKKGAKTHARAVLD